MGDRRAGKNKVNLNVATLDDLADVPGLTRDQAEHILRHRRHFGRFSSIEDVRSVAGCAEVAVDELEHDVTVGHRPARG